MTGITFWMVASDELKMYIVNSREILQSENKELQQINQSTDKNGTIKILIIQKKEKKEILQKQIKQKESKQKEGQIKSTKLIITKCGYDVVIATGQNCWTI